jgi:hypothetical protein
MIKEFFSKFSNREIALIFWVGLVIIVFLVKDKNIRKSSFNVLKAVLAKKLIVPIILLAIYIVATLYFLSTVDIWDLSLLKSTVVWFFFGALVMFFDFGKIKDTSYFKSKMLHLIKLNIVLEFLNEHFTFSLPVEMISVPIIIFFMLIKVFSKTDEKYKEVNSFITGMFTVLGLLVVLKIGYMTIHDLKEILSFATLKEILLTPILTVLIFPFIYFVALWSKYELLFMRLGFDIKDPIRLKKTKREVLLSANININRLNKIETEINNWQ